MKVKVVFQDSAFLSPYGLAGRGPTLNLNPTYIEFRSRVKVEVALMVSVDIKQH